MKIVRNDDSNIEVFLGQETFNLDCKDNLEEYLKQFFNRLKKYYNIEIKGFYDIDLYADKNYDITSKIRSLFDDVIFPLFMASRNTNSTLITQMLSLQKEFIEIDNTTYSSSDKQLPLEEFFLDIINSLPDIPCSKTDLKDFLSSEENNEFVTTLFSQALKSLEENKPFDIVTPLAHKLKLFIDKKDIDVNLGE